MPNAIEPAIHWRKQDRRRAYRDVESIHTTNKQTADAEYAPISRRKFMEKRDLFGRGRFSGRQCPQTFQPLRLACLSAARSWPTRSMIKDFPAYVKMMPDIASLDSNFVPRWLRRPNFHLSRMEKKSRRIPPDHRHEIVELSFHDGRAAQDPAIKIELGESSRYHPNHNRTLGGGNNPTLDQVKKRRRIQ